MRPLLGRRLTAIWRAASLLPVVVIFGCGGDDSATSTYELSGIVEETFSGDRLEGVRITFTSDTLYRSDTTTDDDGYYEMSIETDVPFGQVRADRPGYVTEETAVFFDTNERRVDFDLRPEEQQEEQ